MSGSVANSGELEVMFFDQGATIPVTLPYSGMREIARQWLGENLGLMGFGAANDGQCIRTAMEADCSTFEDGGRGHGLRQMRELVDPAASGSLCMLSGRGRYVYKKGAIEAADTLD